MKKAVILARVSTLRQEKEGLSLKEIQLPKLQEYAKENGFEVVREFVFSESADRKIRTKFNEMTDFVKKDPDIKAIIAFRVDRITRNFRDAVEMDNLRLDHDKELHFAYDRLVIDKQSVGRVIQDWDLKVFLAKQTINRLKEDAFTTSQRKLSNYEWPNGAPFGYKNTKNENNKNWIYIDDSNAEIVKRVFEWYATGAQSMLEVRNKVNEMFGTKYTKSKIDAILKNPFYCGTMIYDGKEYPHQYERIISHEIFESAQKIKAGYNKKHFKFAGLPFAYRGLIRCAECGCIVTPEKKTKPSGKTYHYYHCTQYKGKHGAEWLSEEDLTTQFSNLFSQLTVPSDVADDIVKSLKSSHSDKVEFHDSMLKRYQNDYDMYENRITKMYEDKLDGSITQSFYEEKRIEYRKKQKAINEKIAKLHIADEEYYLNSEYILKLVTNAKSLFESSEPDEKRLLLKMSLQNLTLDGKKVRYDWINPFNKIAFCASRSAWLPLKDLFINREIDFGFSLQNIKTTFELLHLPAVYA